jgi:hypothetical protein
VSNPEGENLYERVHLANLLPNIISPCELHLKFKGKFISLLKKGEAVELEFLHKMHSNDIFFALIKSDDKPLWDNWIEKRFPFSKALKWFQIQEDKDLMKQLATYKAYAFDKIKISADEIDDFDGYLKDSNKRYTRIIKDINLRWYFSHHWTEQSFFQSAKVSYILLLFIDFLKEISKIEPHQDKTKGILQFAIVHHTETEKSMTENEKEYERSFHYIKEKKIIVSQELGGFLKEHMDFYKNLNHKSFDLAKFSPRYKAFSLVEEFEKNRDNIHGGNRKERIEKSLAPLKSHNRMDENLVSSFEKFLKRIIFKI